MASNETMMASEPAVAFGTSSYTDVMGYLHGIRISPEVKKTVALRLLVEASEPYLSKAFARLDELAQMKPGWDGRGGMSISKKVLENVEKVLLISDDNDWRNWLIAPDVNATILLQSKIRRASISIGNSEFSYYAVSGGKRQGENHIAFSPEIFLSLMRKLDK